MPPLFRVVEKTIAELRRALDSGEITSVELVGMYLNRIAHYDRHGLCLNSVPVLNPQMFAEAREADKRIAQGEQLSLLDGIPYTAKDSYKVRGMTVAAGSPAFADLIATEDAFTIAQLRNAGAVLIGLTNMPPMANGGMQRGLYGRAESPYNPAYLTAAFGSGSSNGSGTATAASFAAFGLGEETWSSGRAPASNNGLCAYTPSRGVISTRGNWPLVPTMDVVVPHTRTMEDMLTLLEVVVDDDTETRGDFWRMQPWVEIPKASELRPPFYPFLMDPQALRGKRIAIPRMYINKDVDSDDTIETRESVIALWNAARKDLELLGAEVVETDFPVVTNYESHGDGAQNMVARGLVPKTFAEHELWDLSMWGWHDFLEVNNDPHLHALAQVDGEKIFPVPTGSLPGKYDDHLHRFAPEDVPLEQYVVRAREHGITPLEQIPDIAEGVTGLEKTRMLDLEQWMDVNKFDAVVFPAVADVGPADADVKEESARLAWRNGTWVANGNLVPRHLGIPTVTVPMGVMSDIGMPVGLTFAGRAYDDANLLSYAWAFDNPRNRRTAPKSVHELPRSRWELLNPPADGEPTLQIVATEGPAVGGMVLIRAEIITNATEICVTVDGAKILGEPTPTGYVIEKYVPEVDHYKLHSEWRGAYGRMIIVMARTGDTVVADYTVVCGVG
ncbi:amidase [Aurantimicrobium minutum]|nr:amidase [Aurantimicrobium minutum]MDH6531937.1 amidase [Aurantimicrobium minutum]